MAEGDPLRPGEILDGRYRIGPRIGEGAFAVVHEAARVSDGGTVAVKALTLDAEKVDPAAVARFRREAKLAAELSHPNIVSVLDWGMTGDGRLYLTMERLWGHSLLDVMYEEPFPATSVRHVLQGVLGALAYAHDQGFVHRDVKPSNVFLCAPRPVEVGGGNAEAETDADADGGRRDRAQGDPRTPRAELNRDTARDPRPAADRFGAFQRSPDDSREEAMAVPWPAARGPQRSDAGGASHADAGLYGVRLDATADSPSGQRPGVDDASREGAPWDGELREMRDVGLLGTNEPTANGWAPDHRYRIKVLDFGLSKAVRGDRITFNSPLTSDGHMVGTPGYFAPELLLWDPAGQERPIGPLVDLYAVGLLGYEMLMAEPAFHGVGAAAIFQQLTQQPKPPPTWVRRLTIFPVIEHLMQRDPQQRCPTARAALAALQPPAEIEDAPLLR